MLGYYIMRNLAIAFVALGLASCGVDEVDDGGDGSGSGSGSGSGPMQICQAEVNLTGTFTATATLDPTGGCQPTGTWTINTSVASMGNCATVPVKTQYIYNVTGDGRGTDVAYAGATTGEETVLAVSASGAGYCNGAFEHVFADSGNFVQLTLHPVLPIPTAGGTSLAITGKAEFLRWKTKP